MIFAKPLKEGRLLEDSDHVFNIKGKYLFSQLPSKLRYIQKRCSKDKTENSKIKMAGRFIQHLVDEGHISSGFSRAEREDLCYR